MALQIIVKGKVQGVFFRSFVKDIAKKLGIRGFVRNQIDGTIEIVAEGPDEALQQLIKACIKGPPGAEVKDIKTTKQKDEGFKNFDILYK
jgi:acylphosphatase